MSSGRLPTNTSGLGTVNRGRVLNVIARSGPISRAEIARLTGLTPTASGSIVDDLIGEEYVRKSSASLTGPAARRSILVELNGNRAHVAAQAGKQSPVLLAEVRHGLEPRNE